MFIIVFFPNSDSELKGSTSGQKTGTEDTPNSDPELKGSTSGQKIGTEDTTGARGAVPPKCRTNSYSRVKMQS